MLAKRKVPVTQPGLFGVSNFRLSGSARGQFVPMPRTASGIPARYDTAAIQTSVCLSVVHRNLGPLSEGAVIGRQTMTGGVYLRTIPHPLRHAVRRATSPKGGGKAASPQQNDKYQFDKKRPGFERSRDIAFRNFSAAACCTAGCTGRSSGRGGQGAAGGCPAR